MANNIRAKKYRRKYYRNADYTKKYGTFDSHHNTIGL